MKYDGSEKSYQMAKKINLVIHEMQKYFPEFNLTGKFLAREKYGDIWIIEIKDGKAIETKVLKIIDKWGKFKWV